jgi:SAM-dependent methyltransferase
MSRRRADDHSLKRPEWVLRPHREVDVVEGYARWSRVYEDDINLLLGPEAEMVTDLLAGLQFDTALDAAAGTGRHLTRLGRATSIVALDQSKAMLPTAVGKNQSATATSFVRGDLGHLPLADRCFDLVVCALALCHVPEIAPVAAEFSRVLRPGGYLLVSDFHPAAIEWGLRSEFDFEGMNYRLPNPDHGLQGYVDALTGAHFRTLRITELTMATCGVSRPSDLGAQYEEEWPELPFSLGILAQAT